MKWTLPLLCLLLLAPLTLVDVPPLLDYPNHLARAVVLAFPADPFLSQFYAARWAIIPNLATDLILPPLMQLLPVHLAGRLVAGLVLLLPVVGTIAYSRATFGVRAAWPLAAGLVAYNATFLLGFLNFVAACGIALLLAAAWIAWRERHPWMVVAGTTAGVVLLFFCHLMGLLFFLLLLAGHELEWLWRHRTQWRPIARRAAAWLPVVALPSALYMQSMLAPMAGPTAFLSAAEKARQLVFPFANYILPLDVATAGMVAAFLLACLAARRCRVTLGSALTLAMTALLFLAAPFAFKGTYLLDARFAIMLGFLLFGALLPTGLPKPAAVAAMALFALLFGGRMTVVVAAWDGHRADLAALRTAIAPVEPGARVLMVSVTPDDAPGYWRNVPLSRQLSVGGQLDHHLPALLLIERRAWWPFLFDNPSQQPVVTRGDYRALASHADTLIGHLQLETPGKADLCGFDYVLLLDAGGAANAARLAADRLQPLVRTDFAALYRVRAGSCTAVKIVECVGAECGRVPRPLP